MLFDIRIPRNLDKDSSTPSGLAAYLNELGKNIDVIWGAAFDESLGFGEARVTLIASEK